MKTERRVLLAEFLEREKAENAASTSAQLQPPSKMRRSFDALLIGTTRRLEPADRIKELSDASVPFEFDVHAMIACDDAPKLEAELHAEFDDLRINRVNYRKEFFRLPVDRLRAAVANRSVDVSFTMVAEAKEYRESVALSKMRPEEREMYLEHQEMALNAD